MIIEVFDGEKKIGDVNLEKFTTRHAEGGKTKMKRLLQKANVMPAFLQSAWEVNGVPFDLVSHPTVWVILTSILGAAKELGFSCKFNGEVIYLEQIKDHYDVFSGGIDNEH